MRTAKRHVRFTPNSDRESEPLASRRPRQTTRELRVIGLGYVKWSAEQPDISAAKSRFQIVDREMPEPDTGHVGAILSSGGPTDAIQECQHRRSQYFLS